MPLAVLVIDRDAPLEELRELRRAERRLDRDIEQGLDLVEQESPVAIGAGEQRLARLGGDGERAVNLRLGAGQQFLERHLVEPVKDQHLAARQQRRVEFEARIFGGRADQGHRAILDERQEAVLLGAIEAVDLVDEQ